MSNSRQGKPLLPALFRNLISHVNRSANKIDRPESFEGILLFTAERKPEQKTYRISLKRSTALTTEQVAQIMAIMNQNQSEENKSNTLPLVSNTNLLPPSPANIQTSSSSPDSLKLTK